MIHILTVHWKDPRWINIQLDYLEKYISSDYQVYAFLNNIPNEYESKFYYCNTENITSHAIKLNILADIASFNSTSSDDIIMFIDGDAFPVAPLKDYIEQSLADSPLVAIQRKENNGDIQPHPCFCATTVRFWNEINGDWKEGFQWRDKNNQLVTDVGGNLLQKLMENNYSWKKMLRSNISDIHPLWFGVYDGLIYHHGAGFRAPLSREDAKIYRKIFNLIVPLSLRDNIKKTKLIKKVRDRIVNSKELMEAADNIYNKIKTDDNFFKSL